MNIARILYHPADEVWTRYRRRMWSDMTPDEVKAHLFFREPLWPFLSARISPDPPLLGQEHLALAVDVFNWCSRALAAPTQEKPE